MSSSSISRKQAVSETINCINQSPSSKSGIYSVSQEHSLPFKERESLLPQLQQPDTGSYPKPD